MNASGEKTILMVEDSDEDFVATQRALDKSGYDDIKLRRTENAAQAFDFLLARGRFAQKENAAPSLILLDLNLPGVDGREFLAQIKRDERLKKIPVVVLTTSCNPNDVVYCFENGANGYQVKPVGFDKYLKSIKSMINYWFETAVLPATVKDL